MLFKAVVREVLDADAKRHFHAPRIAIIVLRVPFEGNPSAVGW
ncbi:hypothetical protein APV28_3638 [Comamonas testosteroni]|nr:hypothetical protein APV28_3638 [Comamonas testosteroni]